MVIVSNLLKVGHLLKILNILSSARQWSSLSCWLKSSESEMILCWKWQIKWHWLRLNKILLLLITDKIYTNQTCQCTKQMTAYWFQAMLSLHVIVLWQSVEFCMSTSWISIANYNFSSQFPKQIMKWISSLTLLHKNVSFCYKNF